MARYVAFIRAINIGGRRISNADLAAHFEALGFDGAAVYQAAGNVVLDTDDEDAARVTRAIDEGLTGRLGYDCLTYLRTADEVRAIAEAEPFGSDVASGRKMHVALLEKLPAKKVADQVLALGTDDDRLAFGARELYWLPKGRMMESDLDLRALEKLAGGWTMRTKGTIERIAARYFAD
jgi:uncharacterized protein (DUF1697 family)